MSKEIVYVSPSQIKQWNLCKRKWAFSKINRLVEPTSLKQAFGTAGHAQLEKWLKEGKAPNKTPAGQVALQGIQEGWLPTPSKKLKVEHKFDFSIITKEDYQVRMLGYIDCFDPADSLVIDHKFTGDLKWAMTPDQLQLDPQAIIYSRFAHDELKQSNIKVRWLYYRFIWPTKKPGGSKKVEHLFDWDSPDLQHMWNKILRICDEIAIAKLNWKNAEADAPATLDACSAFGGCFFRHNGCSADRDAPLN